MLFIFLSYNDIFNAMWSGVSSKYYNCVSDDDNVMIMIMVSYFLVVLAVDKAMIYDNLEFF